MAVALVALLPLLFVVVQALHVGLGPVRAVLGRPVIGTLVRHTVLLTLTVTLATVVLGGGAAWLVERTDLPLRRALSVALVLPLAVPEFVQGFSWVALTSNVRGFWGALLVMSCSLYPLVYLPVAASLRRSDPALEEVSRSSGRGPWTTLWRVTIPLNRAAIGGGALLVALYLLGEYGAFAVLRYQTFATAIYTEYHVAYDVATASVLTLLLCLFGLVLVGGEAAVSGHRPAVRSRLDGRSATRQELGRWRWPSLAVVLGLLGLALGVPAAALAYWFVRGSSSTLPSASIVGAIGHTLTYSLSAGVLATALSVPVALRSWRTGSRSAVAVERGIYLTRAIPGIAVGLAVIYATIRYARPVYEQAPMLIAGYVVLFFPLALTGVRAGLAGISTGVEEVARSLGATRTRVLLRVTLPLLVPGLGVAASLVAVSASTELTATLLLRPIGSDTLATQFWTYTTGLAYGAAAPYAAVMVAIALVPVLLLARRGVLR